MSLQVLSPGLLTTVQDAGRHGFRHLGVGASGALDGYSLQIANWLVGNHANAAVLEITLTGPHLRMETSARVALCGAEVAAQLDGQIVPQWRPVHCPAGSELRIGHCKRGARVVLAVAGGIEVPGVLGSASTDLRGGFGGFEGRALRAGDRLSIGTPSSPPASSTQPAEWWIDPSPEMDFDRPAIVQFLPTRERSSAADAISATRWLVSARSDRQGLRLQGAPARASDNMSGDTNKPQVDHYISEPVIPGSVQLPPDGQPIVLLADAQTHGGYPCIGHVISSDLPRLAQLRSGDGLHFVPIDRPGARREHLAQRARLARIAMAIQARTGMPLLQPR